MSLKTLELPSAFEALPPTEKLDFATEIFKRLPPVDSGPLSDAQVAMAGDAMASILSEEEDDAASR